MIKLLLIVLSLTSILQAVNTVPCSVPTGKVSVLDPNRATVDINSTVSCTSSEGYDYVCFSNNEIRIYQEKLDTLPNGSCTYRTLREYFIYINDGCTPYDTWTKFSSSTECTLNNLNFTGGAHYYIDTAVCDNWCYAERAYCEKPKVYDASLGHCILPINCTNPQTQCEDFGEDFGGWKYRTVCDNDTSATNRPYTTDVTGFCTAPDGNTTQTDTNTTQETNTTEVDTNSTNIDTNTSTSSNTNTDNGTTTGVGGDTAILGNTYGIEGKLNEVNTNLGLLIGSTDSQTDVLLNTSTYQGNRLHDDITALRGEMDISNDQLHSHLRHIADINRDGFNGLSAALNNLNTNNGTINGDGNTTIDFDDSRIVQANNNTTQSVKDILDFLQDENISDGDLNSSLEDGNSSTWSDTLSKFKTLLDDMNISQDELTGRMRAELEAQTIDFEDKSKNMLSDLLNRIFSDLFNPFQPFIDVGSVSSNFNPLKFSINISAINFHEDVYMTKEMLLGDTNNPNIAKFYEIMQKLSMFIAVIFGFLYFIRGVSDV